MERTHGFVVVNVTLAVFTLVQGFVHLGFLVVVKR